MKYFLIYLVALSSCGTTGHIVFYNFNASKMNVESEILRLVKSDSNLLVPRKWVEHTKGDYFERIYVYFRDSPEEMYQIGFSGDSTTWASESSCKLALISIYQGDQFKYEEDLDNSEMERIEARLEDNILNKLKYHYTKSVN